MKGIIQDYLKDIPTYNITGIACWDYDGVMKATGAHRNTVCNWIRNTRLGKLDLPFICRKKGCRCWFPVDEFISWYRYAGQN